jgi:REP element-mobilizing transposase RayT
MESRPYVTRRYVTGRFNPDTHHRRSLRLRGADYARPGAYFITVCTRERLCWFGDVVGDEVVLSSYGHIVDEVWQSLPARWPNVEIDACVVMPNHFHGVIVLKQALDAAVPLGEVVRTFKAASARLIRSEGERFRVAKQLL